MVIFKSLYRWKSKVKSIAFLSSREHSRMNSSNLEYLQRTMTYRTTLERQITQMISSRQLMMHMRANPLCLTKLGGGQDGDLIMAFFPCIYFTGSTNPCYYTLENNNYKNLTTAQKIDQMLQRSKSRQQFYELIIKLVGVCLDRGIRIIIENPYSSLHYLCNNFFKAPDVFDRNRQHRGDYFKKPTGYWYFNCVPTIGYSYQNPKEKRVIFSCRGAKDAGLCSEERSLISPDYARNFICDFILGKPQPKICPTLFNAM